MTGLFAHFASGTKLDTKYEKHKNACKKRKSGRNPNPIVQNQNVYFVNGKQKTSENSQFSEVSSFHRECRIYRFTTITTFGGALGAA